MQEVKLETKATNHDTTSNSEASSTPSLPTTSSVDEKGQHIVIDKPTYVTDKLYQCVQSLQQRPPRVTSFQLAPPLDAFVWQNVLSLAECEALLQTLAKENMKFDFWNLDAPEKKDLRNADTVEVTDQKLADLLWARVSQFAVPEIHVTGDEDYYEFGLDGTWTACGINPTLLFGKYVVIRTIRAIRVI